MRRNFDCGARSGWRNPARPVSRTVRCAVSGMLLLLSAGAAMAAAETTTPATPATPPTTSPAAEAAEAAQVLGFRSARWGMNAAEVKAAIKKDFNIPPEKVQTEENLSERTTALTVMTGDLIESAGKARISYILGYTTKKLMQVNLIWGNPVDPLAKSDEIVAAANQLRELFASSGYQPGTIRSNVATRDGTIIVFEGQDAGKHATLLTLLNGTLPGAVHNGKRDAPVPTVVLRLSYILDVQNPDIFRLKKGQF